MQMRTTLKVSLCLTALVAIPFFASIFISHAKGLKKNPPGDAMAVVIQYERKAGEPALPFRFNDPKFAALIVKELADHKPPAGSELYANKTDSIWILYRGHKGFTLARSFGNPRSELGEELLDIIDSKTAG